MPIEIIPLQCDGENFALPNFEFFTIERSHKELSGLWNDNPKILDDGVVLFICISGQRRIVIDMNTFQICRGSFCLLLPYTVIQLLEYSDDINMVAITAGVDFLEKLTMLLPVENYASVIQKNPCLQLNERQLQDVQEIYRFANSRFAYKNRPFATEIRDTLLMFIALEVVSLYAGNKPVEKRKLSRHDQIFRNFTYSLTKNFREHREVEFYAEEACLTPRHFSAVIKSKSGRLPSQWIAERTVIFIKFLLENTEMSVQEIANELNFPNPSFFTRYFKKHTGFSPKAYRLQYRETHAG